MLTIYNKSTNPHFNLALEEHLLLGQGEDVFMLWRNSPAVIVGRNQNTLAEINYDFVRENNIAVVRRLTGGGAVFHDLGNVNYTFITAASESGFNNYAAFCRPVIDALAGLGVKAELSGRNDLLIDGRKFSGNAQCSMSGRMLHHGTLMFDADVSYMQGALNVSEMKISSKGIKSVRSRVTNIASHLPQSMSVEQFIDSLLAEISGGELYELSAQDIASTQKLADEKYSLWEWNFGGSRQYAVSKQTRLPQGCFDVRLDVENGAISAIRIYGDYFAKKDITELEKSLIGVSYRPDCLIARLAQADDYIPGVSPQDMLKTII